MDLTESFVKEEASIPGDFITLKKDVIRLPDGILSRREYFLHPGAVMIAPLVGNGDIVMERQFRYPLKQVCIELPAGKINPNEPLLSCAQRELKEETGYTAQKWTEALFFHNAIGYSNEKITLFIAEDIVPGVQTLDPGEFLEVFTMPIEKAIDMIQSGEIHDAKTIIALLWIDRLLKKSR